MTVEETGGSMWTGKVTIYAFFTGVIFPAMAIILRHALRQRNAWAWILFAVSLGPPLQAVILAGRREATSQIFLTVGLVLFFERKVVPPRWLVPLIAALAMLIIPATGSYRSIAQSKNWNQLEKLDLIGNFREFISSESILELRNAAMTIRATESLGEYWWGVGYWDEVIWRFVPAQIVGADVKNWLMIGRDSEVYEDALAKEGFVTSVGSTLTGMGDAFREFGYFGAGVFALIGVFFRSLWLAALRKDAVFARLLYIGTVTSAMRAITHQTVDFLPGLIYQAIFIGILYLFARGRAPRFRRKKATRGPIRQRHGRAERKRYEAEGDRSPEMSP